MTVDYYKYNPNFGAANMYLDTCADTTVTNKWSKGVRLTILKKNYPHQFNLSMNIYTYGYKMSTLLN